MTTPICSCYHNFVWPKYLAFIFNCLSYRNIGQDENKSEADKDETDKTMTPDTHKEDHITPTRSGRNKSKDRQRKTSAKSRMGRRGSAVSPPQVPTPASEIDR